ncbi:MAG: hypothetical protein KJO16_09615 [Muriicola sp.]|nr:hypothetical protein [Muriicola sp.]
MFRFFRQIRQQLLGDGKNTKYLKYAVGEIFLVVIGILLALQINNWNEDRKSRNFEVEMLKQIRVNLLQDRNALSKIATNGNRAMRAADSILSVTEEHDSLPYWLGHFMQFNRFQPLTNGYEVLKSKGLDQIRNKDLRFLLGTYYDDRIKFIGQAIKDIEWEFMNEWLPILKRNVVSFTFGKSAVLKDYSIFTTEGLERNNIVMNKDNYSGSVVYIEEGLQLIDSILEMIDKELKK